MPCPRVTIEGKLVFDPELRFARSGNAVCAMRLIAADRRKNTNTDEWEDGDTLWIDVTAFKQLAEHCAESLTKGDLVLVHGKIKTEEWEKDGEKRSKIAVVADSVGAALQFRTLPHGTGRTERTQAEPGPPPDDPWASSPPSVDPPF